MHATTFGDVPLSECPADTLTGLLMVGGSPDSRFNGAGDIVD